MTIMAAWETIRYTTALIPLVAAGIPGLGAAEPPKLLEADWTQRDDLEGVTSVAVSPDGKHVYSAAFNAGSVVAFGRDPKTGKLEHLASLTEPAALESAVALRLSPDGKMAAVASFGNNTVSTLMRDAGTGELAFADSIGGMGFVIEVAFSSDGKQVYAGCSESVEVLSVDPRGDLKAMQALAGGGKGFSGVRCMKCSADGENVYGVSTYTGEVLAFSRDPETGKLAPLQRVGNGVEAGGPKALEGVHYVALSPGGDHLYAVSGRFGGTDAVSVFARDADGKLAFLQELVAGAKDGPDRFEAGNEIAVSPDGKLVYAVASNSDTIARFARDPDSGKLEFLATVPVGEKAQPGSAGLGFSPDGKFCYIADEAASAVWAYQHR